MDQDYPGLQETTSLKASKSDNRPNWFLGIFGEIAAYGALTIIITIVVIIFICLMSCCYCQCCTKFQPKKPKKKVTGNSIVAIAEHKKKPAPRSALKHSS